MNILPAEKQIQIISALVEGNSIRATARMVGVEHKTVMRVLLRVGEKCATLLDERMRRLPCRLVEEHVPDLVESGDSQFALYATCCCEVECGFSFRANPSSSR